MKLLFILLLVQSTSLYAHNESSNESNSYERVARYSSISTKPSKAQEDLLSVIIEIKFPHTVQTVGNAIDNTLINSGYKLADITSSDPKLLILINSPLPGVHRNLGPIPLRDALKVLSGSAWSLVVDPLHRLVSFDLNQNFKMSNDQGEI